MNRSASPKWYIRKLKLCGATLISILSSVSIVLASHIDPGKQIQIIDSFSNRDKSIKNLPAGWHPSRKDVSMYSINEENGKDYLRVQTKRGCTSIAKQLNYFSDQYPFMSWKWRVHKLPDGGNETKKNKNDSGAAIYVIFKGPLKLNNIIKYVWSSTLPEGTITNSPYNSRARIIVLRSGPEKSGKWISQTVNVHNDYKRLFGNNPPEVVGIGILSDADNTESQAMADYDEISISAKK